MDENKLRRLEKHYKLRVKTGCETCRVRKVKCDESKPACLRCTKTGRKCDGYNLVNKAKKDDHAVAASYRNSSFLVVPRQASIARSPSRSLNPNPLEDRSFEYFQLCTLPMWTEFFDSELWSRTVLQLSHVEPAIKHGILALSTMHERYASITPIFTSNSNDFAFVQYMQAVKHSNELLQAHQEGRVGLELVLIACIIFTCYENLAGNYQAASMHLSNGLRILEQNKLELKAQPNSFESVITNVLYRFDLQAMTFSDNASRYDYALDMAPACPQIQEYYTTNDAARDDLVGLLRCMLWLAGVGEQDPRAPEDPIWQLVHRQILSAFEKWETTFATYQLNIPPHEQADPKIYAGNTLLKMGAITIRIIMGSGAGIRSEMAWDPFLDSFKTIVDLAETVPVLRPQEGTSSPAPSTPVTPRPQASRSRPLAPKPASTTTSTPSSSSSSTFVFSQDPSPAPATHNAYEAPRPPDPTPSFFSPSFELSPIVPLFIVASRCRDPTTRRRAIRLLLTSRRREGVWDSYGAGMVAAQCMKKEENLPYQDLVDFSNVGFLARNPSVQSCSDVPEAARVRDISVAVKVVEGRIDLVYSMTTGEECGEQQVIYESRGDDGGGGKDLRSHNLAAPCEPEGVSLAHRSKSH